MSNITKIYPTKEECQIQTNLACPDCGRIFKTQSNLTMHTFQSHGNMNLRHHKSELQKQFYCPVTECERLKKDKWFKTLRDLREHYLKVHTEKNVCCVKCKKGYASSTLMRRHLEYCGIKFACPSCKVSYESYETLRSHCRRKKHICPAQKTYLNKKPSGLNYSSVKVVEEEFLRRHPKLQPILPKIATCSSVLFFLKGVDVIDSMSEKCSQDSQTTDVAKVMLVSKTTQVNNEFVTIFKRTQETQTAKHSKVNVFTQTEQETKFDISKKNLVGNSDFVLNQKTVDIQTDKVDLCENACNTSFKIEDFEFTENIIEKSSSSTQTIKKDDFYSNSNISTMTHDSIHTDTSDLMTDISNFDSNFFNCNMETQTDFMLAENELFDSEFYSNMYTQTCDEILSGVSSFTDIETQTVLDDVLRSVESQTLMSKIGKIEVNFTNMETQTDSGFLKMLEIINS